MLPQKPSVERTIRILPDYKKKLLEDEKHSITDNFLDYFVFPRIQAEDVNGTVSKEYTTEEDFVSAILFLSQFDVCSPSRDHRTS